MKRTDVKLLLFFITISVTGFTQNEHAKLDITYLKTTSLVFEYPVVNVDRGSRDIIAQKVKGAENMLQVKAARKNFPETNLTVITADGKLYHFYLAYNEEPATQTIWMDSIQDITFKEKASILDYERNAQLIIDKRPTRLAKRGRFKIKFSLEGIYIDSDEIYYRLRIKNKSNVDFDIQSLRFFIDDKQNLKRTARQEIELEPIYVANRPVKVLGRSSIVTVYALRKFTIPEAKALDIELFERNGGRNVKLRIGNEKIVSAKKLPI